VACLFGCWVEELAFEREEGDWRKAAKKVERKKGRWEDMLPLIVRLRGRGLEMSVGVWMVVPVAEPRCTKGNDPAYGLDARFPCSCSVVLGVVPPLVGGRRCFVGVRRWTLVRICKRVASSSKSRRRLQDLSSPRVASLCTGAMRLLPRPLSLLLRLRNPSCPTRLDGWLAQNRTPFAVCR
jgi:hypothetical protein